MGFRFRIMIVFMIASSLLFSYFPLTSTASGETETSQLSGKWIPKDLIIEAPMNINLVVIGDDWSDSDKKSITEKLLKSYTPQIVSTKSNAGVRYEYNYQFIDASSSIEEELFTLIDKIAEEVDEYISEAGKSVPGHVPESIQQWLVAQYPEYELYTWCDPYCEPGIKSISYVLQCVKSSTECSKNVPPGTYNKGKQGYELKYKAIPAFEIEDFLAEHYSDLEGYTLIFFNPTADQIPYFHTYESVSTDPDTDAPFLQEGMMGFGGSYGFYFIDLSAGPWTYPYLVFSEEEVLGQFHENKFTVETDQEYQDLITKYINDATVLLFTPSYLYEPFYNTKYVLDVLIIDQTGGKSFANIAEQYVTKSKVEEAMISILPYTEWEINVEARGFDYLPRDFQRAMIKAMDFKPGEVVIIKSKDLIIELDKFVQSQLTAEELKEIEKQAERTVFLPVIIFVTDPPTYVDDYGVLGLAVPEPSDERYPCCAIITINKKSLQDRDAGLTSVVVHEVSHLFGLMHPHDGIDEKGNLMQNWFFDWSLTPLTYSSPAALGCGLTSTVPCGMVDTEYGAFNFDALDRAIVLDLLKVEQRNVYEAMTKAENLGYEYNSLPENVRNSLDEIDNYFENAKKHFIAMNYFDTENNPINEFDAEKNSLEYFDATANQPIDAVSFAFVAFISSSELLDIVNNLSAPVEEKPPKIEESTEEPAKKSDISVAMKLKKKSALLAIKNTGDTEIYGVKIKASDGNVRYVKAKGWDREKVDASTVIVRTSDKPIIEGRSLLVILVIDNKGSGIEWTALDAKAAVLSSGALIPK